MKPDALDPTDAQRQQRPLVLQAPELPLDRGAAPAGCQPRLGFV